MKSHSDNLRRSEWILCAAVAAWIVALTLRLRALSWDEIENFRATRWTGDGLVPFRDFWEHHTPLQWLIFAPFARWFAHGAGTWPVVVMRLTQLPVWIVIVILLIRVMRSAGCERWAIGATICLLFSARTLALNAVEFRSDHTSCALFLGGLAIALLCRPSAFQWIAFGFLVSFAVLANMRLAPVAVASGALMLISHPSERRWGWNLRGLWMLASVSFTAALSLGWLMITNATGPFFDAMRFNVLSNRMASRVFHGTFVDTLLSVPASFDVSALILVGFAAAGSFFAIREWRQPGALQILTILVWLEMFFVGRLGSNYRYHLELFFLLAAVLAASALRHAMRIAVSAAALVALLVNLGQPVDSVGMAQQNSLMLEVERRTTRNDLVWDAVGYAIDRRPACHYWFLPTGVRMLAKAGLLPAYGVGDLRSHPPAAIIFTKGLAAWFSDFPDMLPFLRRNYIPRQRDLWIPAMSAVVSGQSPSREWVVLVSGTYHAYAIESLAMHPWFRDPLPGFRFDSDARPLATPLNQLPQAAPSSIQWLVNGEVMGPQMKLRRGDRVRVESRYTSPVGVVIVPAEVTKIFEAPADRFPL